MDVNKKQKKKKLLYGLIEIKYIRGKRLDLKFEDKLKMENEKQNQRKKRTTINMYY